MASWVSVQNHNLRNRRKCWCDDARLVSACTSIRRPVTQPASITTVSWERRIVIAAIFGGLITMKYREAVSLAALATVLGLSSAPAFAADAATDAADTTTAASDVDESQAIIVTGTRTTGMKAADSPAPIQLLSGDEPQRTGSPDLIQSLAQCLRSIQAQSFGGDLQAHESADEAARPQPQPHSDPDQRQAPPWHRQRCRSRRSLSAAAPPRT